jgi:hypothetical protein
MEELDLAEYARIRVKGPYFQVGIYISREEPHNAINQNHFSEDWTGGDQRWGYGAAYKEGVKMVGTAAFIGGEQVTTSCCSTRISTTIVLGLPELPLRYES